mmetsp:Transcript_20618/g.36696  ORF Transcript_20618/g.36696 Transcript_20618/m.36696 type:complete len:138 (-) Transcript_20618:47-460(-)
MGGCLPCLGTEPVFTPEEREKATAALILATKSKDVEACTKALKGGADPNAANKDFFNYTAMHLFAGAGDLEMVSLLLSKKANIDPRSESHETPLIMAARAKHKLVAEVLVEQGADTSAETNYPPPMRKSAQQYMDEM